MRGPPHGIEKRFVSTAPSSYDADSRTVEAVISNGAAVARFYGTEVLRIDSRSVVLDRLSGGGIPVLDSHQQVGISNSIGLLRQAWIERGALVGRIAFHDTAEGRMAEGMVRRGEVRGVSAGYRVMTWEITNEDGDVIDPEVDRMRWDDDLTFTAVKWELLECSLVSVPADADAAVRSLSNPSQTVRDTRARMRVRQEMSDRMSSTTRNVRGIKARMLVKQQMHERQWDMEKRQWDMEYSFRDGADDPPVAAEAGGLFRDGGLAARSGLLRRVAFHEAGHVTVALAQGRRIEFATVVPGHNFLGKVSGDETPKMMADLLDLLSGGQTNVEVEACARAHVVEYLAGRISEWLFATAESWMSDRNYSASSDLKLATAFARAICGSDEAAEKLLDHARTEAREILETNADVVLAIADALMERGTLSGFEIEEIISHEQA